MNLEKQNSLNIKLVTTIYIKVAKLIFRQTKLMPITLIFLTIILGSLPAISTTVTQIIFNEIQVGSATINTIIPWILAYVLIDIGTVILNNISSYLTFILKNKLNLYVSSEILIKVSKMTLVDLENSETYNKIQRAQSQTGAGIYDYFMYLLVIFQSIIGIVSFGYILTKWNIFAVPAIGLLSIIQTVFLIYISRKQYKVIFNRTNEDRKKWYFQYLLNNDIAFKEIKIYNLSKYFIGQYRGIFKKFIKQDTKIMNERTIGQLVISIFDRTFLGFVFYKLISSTTTGKILIGDAMAFIRSITNIKTNMESFLNQIVNLSNDTQYINLLFELLETETKDETLGITIGKIKNIEFKNVNYTYEGSNRETLKNINFTIDCGSTVAIVGRNGSGKSTLIKLLAGYYDNYEGEILINGIELRKISKISYYKQIGILLQDFAKFELTLRENIALSDLSMFHNDSVLYDLLKIVDFNGRSNQIDLDSQLGYWFDFGSQLSGGEWMKIAISRSLLKNSSICILDEPNASLDNIIGKKVFIKIREIFREKIGIIITHRINDVKDIVDNIIVMDSGRIAANGTYEYLKYNNDIFQQLINEEKYTSIY